MAATSANVGSEVQAMCGRCHESRLHVIVSAEGGKPARVQCRTCDASHRFRAPVDPGNPPVRKKRTTKKADALPPYDEALKQATTQPTEAYLMTGRYAKGQRLQHASFGEGVVVRVVSSGVIEVVFREGPRKLAIGR